MPLNLSVKLYKNSGFAPIMVIVAMVILAGLVGGGWYARKVELLPNVSTPPITTFDECVKAGYRVGESNPRQCFAPDKTFVEGERACAQEAKLCPDGNTYVSRTGPNCEFAACPGETSIDISTLKALEQKPTRDGFGLGLVQAADENPNVAARCAALRTLISVHGLLP